MDSKKVLIAYDSDIIIDLLKSFLEEAEWQVDYTKDGIMTLKKLFYENYDCLIVSTELPVINGYSITHIVKGNDELKNTAVIISASEQGNDERFWAENSKCDAFYVPSSENLGNLTALVEKVTSHYTRRANFYGREIDERDIINLLSTTSSRELSDLYLIRDAFNIENYVWDLDHLLSQLAKSISSIYNYDVLGIIVNEDKVVEYYDKSDSIVKNDFQDFRTICQTDFTSRNNSRKDFNWANSVYSETIIEQFSPKKEKLKNYNIFPVDPTKKFPFTIHVATTSCNAMSISTQKRLDFLADVYSPVIEKIIIYNKSITTEANLKNAFSRFLPPKVIEGIIEGDNSITSSIGEQRKVAILMADIRDFTSIAESNEPEKIVRFLNDYFTRMGNIIKKHGGTIDKFMGDEIMALFGVPESYKYNGYRAANAAAEMLKELENIDTSFLNINGDSSIKIGIGVHYGQPIAGTIGSEDKKEFTVIGNDVNLSARIENLTKLYGTSILITDAVKKDIEAAEADVEFGRYLSKHEHYFLRYIDNVKVKGKSIPVQIFELYNDKEKYTWNFSNNFSKGLFQYLAGNFNGALDYLRIAKVLAPKDKATLVLLERCRKFVKEHPAHWDGSITLTTK